VDDYYLISQYVQRKLLGEQVHLQRHIVETHTQVVVRLVIDRLDKHKVFLLERLQNVLNLTSNLESGWYVAISRCSPVCQDETCPAIFVR